MALRPLGIYLMTGSALYAQTKTTYHLTEMSTLAAKSTALTLLAAGETETAIELQRKAAMDAEEGLEMQSESIKLEASAEKETAEAAEEIIVADEYKEEAVLLHNKAVKDELESESLFEKAEGLETSSEEQNIIADQDVAAAETYEEQAAFEYEQATNAEKLAEDAEVRAAKDEAIVLEKESASAKDAKALARTETGVVQDAEGVAACEVIPVLNVLCDIAGAITEAGFQSMAALEAAKSAIESTAAATWSGKERKELVIASEKHSEAATDFIEGDKYHSMSVDSGEAASTEKFESASLHESALDAHATGEEKLVASQEEESLSKVDEEEATRHSEEAARHEATATDEKAASIASELESQEKLDESTAEEFEAQSERQDAESQENRARKLMEESIGHGLNALKYVVTSILIAVGVIYVVTMKTLIKRVTPTVSSVWKGDHRLSGSDYAQVASEAMLHVGFILVTVVMTASSLSNYEGMTTLDRWRELFYLALVVGLLESLLVYAIPTGCSCLLKGNSGYGMIAVHAGLEFFRKAMHIVPVVLIELLILLTLCGPEVLSSAFLLHTNPCWIWSALLSLVILNICFFRLKSFVVREANHSSNSSRKSYVSASLGWEEDALSSQENSFIGTIVDQEYGSIEEVCLLSSTKQPSELDINVSTSNLSSMSNCFHEMEKHGQKLVQALCARLDILAISLMVMLIYQNKPAIQLLHPLVVRSFALSGISRMKESNNN